MNGSEDIEIAIVAHPLRSALRVLLRMPQGSGESRCSPSYYD
jgi:hypothetical protein